MKYTLSFCFAFLAYIVVSAFTNAVTDSSSWSYPTGVAADAEVNVASFAGLLAGAG